jgi:hypothetical protein
MERPYESVQDGEGKEIMQLDTTFAKAALKKETWPSYYTTSVI